MFLICDKITHLCGLLFSWSYDQENDTIPIDFLRVSISWYTTYYWGWIVHRSTQKERGINVGQEQGTNVQYCDGEATCDRFSGSPVKQFNQAYIWDKVGILSQGNCLVGTVSSVYSGHVQNGRCIDCWDWYLSKINNALTRKPTLNYEFDTQIIFKF